MRKTVRESLCLWALGALVLPMAIGGCHCTLYSTAATTPQPIYVSTPPPPVKVEIQPPAPSAGYVWIEGHWDWNDADTSWVWVEGTWTRPPKEGWQWVPPKFDDREDNDVYTPGHWSETGVPSHPEWKQPPKVVAQTPSDTAGGPQSTDSATPEKPDSDAKPKDDKEKDKGKFDGKLEGKGQPSKPEFEKTEKVDVKPKDDKEKDKGKFDGKLEGKGQPSKPEFEKTEKVDLKPKKKQGEIKAKDDIGPSNPGLKKKESDIKAKDPQP
ncbi:MAG: YXWGXW repeat-containing protein [Myxococcota bacterium]|jgi:hypothetical protein|nr:YXWGXW repeat-containing protein [Myxococcota bacterium]